MIRDHEKPKQDPKRRRWHDEEVQRDQVLEVVVQERSPRRRGRPATLEHVLTGPPSCGSRVFRADDVFGKHSLSQPGPSAVSLDPTVGAPYPVPVRVIARRTLREFWEQRGHGDAEQPLRAWFAEARRATWRTPSDVKAAYRNASFVGNDRVVFNIGGNKYASPQHQMGNSR